VAYCGFPASKAFPSAGFLLKPFFPILFWPESGKRFAAYSCGAAMVFHHFPFRNEA
jgi:hypothetical protein